MFCATLQDGLKNHHTNQDHMLTVYHEVGSNKKMKGDAMEMNTNTAYGSHVS